MSARIETFSKALQQLDAALALPVSDVVRDACIQRFEFSFELAWKAIQQAARDQGRDCVSPKSCLRAAFALGWLGDENAWLIMLSDRNLTSHTYNEEIAQAVYGRMKTHASLLKELNRTLSNIR
jgi:nucleotidyltransferase substrate binding protein (TIGR01987 family)